MKSTHYNDNVFINCPFDLAYKPLLDAIVFAVHDCGFVARCALEEGDASQVRIDKIGLTQKSLTELRKNISIVCGR